MSKHTPGPWSAYINPITRKGTVTLDPHGSNAPLKCPLDAADAQLIAAAPELLAALKRLVQQVKLTKPSSLMVPLIEDAEDAIAKAEG